MRRRDHLVQPFDGDCSRSLFNSQVKYSGSDVRPLQQVRPRYHWLMSHVVAVNAPELAERFDLARLEAAFYADPYPTYHALRAHAPVKRMENGSWLLTRYDDILPVYRDPKGFSSD